MATTGIKWNGVPKASQETIDIIGANVEIVIRDPKTQNEYVTNAENFAGALTDLGLISGSGGYWDLNGNDIFNTNSGNVGIGTASPTHKLDILGDFNQVYNNFSIQNGDSVILTSDGAVNKYVSGDDNYYAGVIDGGGTILSVDGYINTVTGVSVTNSVYATGGSFVYQPDYTDPTVFNGIVIDPTDVNINSSIGSIVIKSQLTNTLQAISGNIVNFNDLNNIPVGYVANAGNALFSSTVEAAGNNSGFILASGTGVRYKIVVDDAGVLSTVSV